MRKIRPGRPDRPAHGAGVLARLADTMFVHKKKVMLGWVAILAVAIAGGLSLAGTYTADYSTPGSDSKAASDRLVEKFAGHSGESVDIVWKASGSATAPSVTARIDRLLEEVGTVRGIAPGTTAADAEVSRDVRTAIARLQLDRSSGQVPVASG
jgi:RND superfamily putative drug exporter